MHMKLDAFFLGIVLTLRKLDFIYISYIYKQFPCIFIILCKSSDPYSRALFQPFFKHLEGCVVVGKYFAVYGIFVVGYTECNNVCTVPGPAYIHVLFKEVSFHRYISRKLVHL